MTSQQAELAIRDQKEVTMAATAEEQPKLEVNGHADAVTSTQPKPELDVNHTKANEPQNEQVIAVESTETNHISNKDALSSEMPVPAKTSIENSTPTAAPEASIIPDAGADVAPKESGPSAPDSKDTKIDDAPTATAELQAPTEAKPVAVGTIEKPTGTSGETEASSTTKADVISSEAPSAPPPAKTDSKEDATDSKRDIVMEDAEPAVKSDAVARPAESTQNGAAADEPSPRAAAEISLDISSTSFTADTSMTDVSFQPAPKVAREREEDGSDEPAAKRAKTEAEDEEIRVEPKPSAQQSIQGEMAIDDSVIAQPAGPTVPTRDDEGKVKYLNDPSLDNNPITLFQNREIRRSLALVKKTKNGMLFKDPVSKTWPHLWDSYIAKVDNPTDISTMEKKLRETEGIGSFATLGEFKIEARRLELNSIAFNGEDHGVTSQAKQVVDQIMERLSAIPAEEPAKSEKKDTKHQPTRHTEPRAAAQRRPSRGAATSPEVKVADNVVAVPASGVPVIRRQSTKNDEDRPKRPIHPPKNKDLEYEPKNFKKQKLTPEFRFCDEVLTELKKKKHEFNQFFLNPVDPIIHGVPTYWSIIKKPMDLSTMADKLHRGEYKKTKDFENDFSQIVKNCVKFNGEGHPVTHQVRQLEALFKEKWAEKDEWIANHAPPAATSAGSSHSGGLDMKDDSEEEDVGGDQGDDEELTQARALIDGLNNRLKEETEKLNKMLTTSDRIAVQVQRGLVTTLQDEIIKASQKLGELEKQQKKPAKPKPSKRKSVGGAGAGGAGAKRANAGGAGAAGKKAGGGAKKSAKSRTMGQIEKDIIAEGINDLDGSNLDQAIDIIKKDTNQTENDTGELELDIEQLSNPALIRLFDIIAKVFPNLRKKQEDLHAAAAAAAATAAAAAEPARQPRERAKANRGKKNKPMNKVEQERKLAQLREVQAAFARPGSGSQEPVPSVEEPNDQDSDDEEEDSEEE